jgi:ESF2/ABP1 family protein
MASDARFQVDERFAEDEGIASASVSGSDEELDVNVGNDEPALAEGMDIEGFAGPSKIVKPLTPEALKAFNAAQAKTGVVYISRIPPGMRPTKVRHLMGQHGEIGRVYLQQEGASFLPLILVSVLLTEWIDAKRAYLRRKHTSTKKAHFTEGWVEFKDKRVARAAAEMLNAQPIGGKKGTRWRDDVWTMKYLPRFKWDMLTEQIGTYPIMVAPALLLLIHLQPTKPRNAPHSCGWNSLSLAQNNGIISRTSSWLGCSTNVSSARRRLPKKPVSRWTLRRHY